MPVNYFSSEDLPKPLMFTKQHHIMERSGGAAAAMFGAENFEEHLQSDEEVIVIIPKEPLFEKPLTPSDVGKLNRLVIPKQHAEKYFPLAGQDSCGGEKGGLLLGFEDECGKHWRFRYSYWTSSQSYVLTKGWSRFVKEKRLDAGDVVLFERHRVDAERFFIGWRRRSSVATVQNGGGGGSSSRVAQPTGIVVGGGGGWGHGWHPYPPPPSTYSLPYQPNCLHAGIGSSSSSCSAVPNQTAASGNSRRSVRLFGVNLECEPNESEPNTPECSTTSSPSQSQSQSQSHSFQYYANSHPSYDNYYNHMDINFSRDVNQMRYHQG